MPPQLQPVVYSLLHCGQYCTVCSLPPWPEAPSLHRTRPASGRSRGPETEASSHAESDGPTNAPAAS